MFATTNLWIVPTLTVPSFAALLCALQAESVDVMSAVLTVALTALLYFALEAFWLDVPSSVPSQKIAPEACTVDTAAVPSQTPTSPILHTARPKIIVSALIVAVGAALAFAHASLLPLVLIAPLPLLFYLFIRIRGTFPWTEVVSFAAGGPLMCSLCYFLISQTYHWFCTFLGCSFGFLIAAIVTSNSLSPDPAATPASRLSVVRYCCFASYITQVCCSIILALSHVTWTATDLQDLTSVTMLLPLLPLLTHIRVRKLLQRFSRGKTCDVAPKLLAQCLIIFGVLAAPSCLLCEM